MLAIIVVHLQNGQPMGLGIESIEIFEWNATKNCIIIETRKYNVHVSESFEELTAKIQAATNRTYIIPSSEGSVDLKSDWFSIGN